MCRPLSLRVEGVQNTWCARPSVSNQKVPVVALCFIYVSHPTGVKLNIHDVLLQQSGQHVVLVDLSTWSTASEEDQKDIASILAYITVTDNAIGVVAHSSGGGSFSVNKVAPTFETQLFSLGSYPVVTFVPFNDGEAQVFWPEGQALSLKALKPLTNYNPSLLKLCINKEDRNAAFKSVWSDVKKHTAGMMRSLCAQDAIWYESNTQLSMDILYCAANGLSMSNDRFTLYCSTWLDMEGVTYAVKDDANGVFYPKVNFPVIVQLLMEHFRNIEVPCEIHNDAVKGYRFQAHFLNNPGVLHITCKRAGGTPTLIVFDNVVPLPASEGLALDRLSLGSLVQLREKHPVIDAVGRLKDQGGKEWLVLMQVSLSKYDQHKSKVGDLYNTITWPESVSATKVDCSWLQYYRNLCNSTLDCMYVYISPKELGPDPDFVLGEKGVRSRTKELYLGLVAKGSSTAKNMSVCEVKSSRSASSVL